MVKTKNLFSAFALGIVGILFCVFAFVGCGAPTYKVDGSVAKVQGVTFSVSQELGKKQFGETDSAARQEKFGTETEYDVITFSVKGTVKESDCAKNATACDSDGNVVDGEGVVNYYTDYFEMSIKIPENVKKIATIDGLPAKGIEELGDRVKDGYYVEKVQWLLGGADKTGWTICGNAETKDGFFKTEFLDKNDEVVATYLVRVVYDVTFEAEEAE